MSAGSAWYFSIDPDVDKRLKKLSRPDRERIEGAIFGLPAGDVVALKGKMLGHFRLRVGGWRVRFQMEASSQTIYVYLIDNRGRAYKST